MLRTLANIILSVAVLLGQSAANLNLCLACAHVSFESDSGHDCHDEHSDHGFAAPESQCGYCTQTDFATIHFDADPLMGIAPAIPQFIAANFFHTIESIPNATESPPRGHAPAGAFILLC